MIEIDGSFGEGGGQIVRTAVSLSAVTSKPVRITGIRKGRPKPGLASQHAHAIRALADICGAETTGVKPGSSEIAFSPGRIRGGCRQVEIGTAGSVTLLMQCLVPALLMADAPSSILIRGGTDVKWAPTIDYFKYVFMPAVSAFGVRVSLSVLIRGYYPRGGGEVRLDVEPGDLKPAHFSTCEQQALKRTVLGISHCSNLPEHVASRQAEAAEKHLLAAGYVSEIKKEVLKLPSTGSGITLWAGGKGASALGERGLPAEKVGFYAAFKLIRELETLAAVDVHLADQLIVYLALAGGSMTLGSLSEHTKTNIWTVGHFLDAKMEIKEANGIFRIESLLPSTISQP